MVGQLVKIAFKSPVHFGRGRLVDSAFACDAATLFSALFIEALHMGVADGLLNAVRTGDLTISDTLPYIGETLYLPKPMAVFEYDEEWQDTLDSRAKKASRKLDYIPADSYSGYLDGSFDVIGAYEDFNGGLGTAFVQTKANLMRSDRPDAKPYQVGGFEFASGAGIYFLAEGSYDIRPILDQLSYSGLGGKCSSGYGRFEYTASDEGMRIRGISAKRVSGAHILLSTATPGEGELDDGLLEGARYKLVRKGGFVQSATYGTTPQKKRDMYLFTAGSMFKRLFDGAVFDVNTTPGAHPVYRYARAMWLEV